MTRKRKTPPLRSVAWACALLVWVLGLLAASPELHAALHGDADQGDHECAVTLFSHGTETAAPGPVLTVDLHRRVESVLPRVTLESALSSADRLRPARGPPGR